MVDDAWIDACMDFGYVEKSLFRPYLGFAHFHITNLTRVCFPGPKPVLALNVWANGNPKDDTSSRKPSSRLYGCEADALPHNHGHYK